MKLLYRILLLIVSVAVSTFGYAQLQVDFSPLPVDLGVSNTDAVHALGIPYATEDVDRQIVHLFLPDTLGQSPLIIFIHGGGFRGGSPNQGYTSNRNITDIQYCMANGIAYASLGYRLIQNEDDQGVIKSLGDSRTALQFLRTYAADLHIDPERIVVKGNSAGASASLYLAVMDDFSDPLSGDLVAQASTRVCAASLNASQATLDLVRWETDVFRDYDGNGTAFTLDSMAIITGFNTVSEFYGGIDSIEDLYQDSLVVEYRQSVDALANLSPDDPPLYLTSLSTATHPSEDLTHHSLHAQTLISGATEAGIREIKARVPARLINTTNGESEIQFLHRHLLTCAVSTEVESIDHKLDVTVYPNPATDRISITLGDGSIAKVEVYTLNGELVILERNRSGDNSIVPTDHLVEGVYLLHVTTVSGDHLVKQFSVIN